jgi:hypothetical protein
VKSERVKNIPVRALIQADGQHSTSGDKPEGSLTSWYQPAPFMICLNCLEYYDAREKYDYKKLSGLAT